MFNRTHFKKFYRAKTQRKISSYFSELGVLYVFAGSFFSDSAIQKHANFKYVWVAFS